ncbi:M28 family peptidase [Luteolibacter algae]|uniref:M28 family peptidase n=1 Tax=Luteolibacter algae TaxID=454151 RepID=UPI0036D8C82E
MKTKWILLFLITAAAVAAIFLRNPGSQSSKLGEDAHAVTMEILAQGPRPPGSEGLDKVRALLKDKLENAGWAVTFQEFERDTSIGKIKFSNLRARFKTGKEDPWERQVRGILCAHIDSKYFKDKEFLAADDAASACAAIVVMAKNLAEEKPQQAADLELVLFDGEEAFAFNMTILDGLYGSRFYANSWRARDDKPKFGILLDMVGHKDLKIRIPSDSPEKLSSLMFSAAEKNGVSKHFGTAAGSIMDDHVPLNLVGIPTLDIIGDFPSTRWWHTPGDNASIISTESLGITIGVVEKMLDELLKE